MREDLLLAAKNASAESRHSKNLYNHAVSGGLADVEDMLSSDERVLLARGARLSSSGPADSSGLLLVTTKRLLYIGGSSGVVVPIREISAYDPDSQGWPNRRESWIIVTARGSRHRFYFEGDKNDSFAVGRAIMKATMTQE